MPNLTLSIDEEVLKQARIRAVEQGTSVNAVVHAFLESYASISGEAHARERFIEISNNSDAGNDDTARSWVRDDIYHGRGR